MNFQDWVDFDGSQGLASDHTFITHFYLYVALDNLEL